MPLSAAEFKSIMRKAVKFNAFCYGFFMLYIMAFLRCFGLCGSCPGQIPLIKEIMISDGLSGRRKVITIKKRERESIKTLYQSKTYSQAEFLPLSSVFNLSE